MDQEPVTTTLAQQLALLSEQYGDPLEILFQLAANPALREQDRIAAAKAACEFKYPKRKQVELEMDRPPVPPVIEIVVTQQPRDDADSASP